jgi:uncharacterized membrane protein YciS (DUF1049 family)
MRTVVAVIVILVVVLLLGGMIHSIVGQVPLLPAVQDVITGLVGIVSDLGNTIGRMLSGITPKFGEN